MLTSAEVRLPDGDRQVLPHRPAAAGRQPARRPRTTRARRCAPTCRARPSSRPTCARCPTPRPQGFDLAAAVGRRQGAGAAEDRRLAAQGPQGRAAPDLKVSDVPATAEGAAQVKTRDPQARRRTSSRSSGSRSSRRWSGGYILHQPAHALPVGGQAVPAARPRSPPRRPSRPGQGQTVRVSGVRVGDITKVDLEGRPRGRDDGRSTRSTRTSSTPTPPRCCGPRPG